MRHRAHRRGRAATHGTVGCHPRPPARRDRDMTAFEPIAVVGRGCVLPGALNPGQFWDNLAAGRVSLDTVRPEEWRLPPHSPTATAGMVRGFDDVFDPTGFHLDPDQVAHLDPALRWVLHAGRAALREAGRDGRLPTAGLVLGNLGFPSRPLHRDADGLVPAEGAAIVALTRLRDAVAARVPVIGVVRGIGLSNDGRTGGFLVPAEDGQLRAMRDAYDQAGFGPETLSLLECHATGTPVGDAVEARATATFFAAHPDLPVGSAKSNVGHLLTASGAAGLLKVLGAIEHGVRPATAGPADPIDELGGPTRLLTATEPWPGRRRAAVSAFGFGGNNAHLIVEAFDGVPATTSRPTPATEVAIVSV